MTIPRRHCLKQWHSERKSRLTITRRGGAAHAYRVEIGAVPTGFVLRIPAGKNATDRFNMPAGGTMRIPIECVRSGYNGNLFSR